MTLTLAPPTRCFLMEATDLYSRYLRRYANGPHPCPGPRLRYHDATRLVGTDLPLELSQNKESDYQTEFLPAGDPRWPTRCAACGYEFQPLDPRQWQTVRLYRSPVSGARLSLADAPTGALWFADWFGKSRRWVGPDGRCLCVQTPGGPWCVDAPESGGRGKSTGGWQRVGVPPVTSAHPSVLIGGWHGWLREGRLVTA